ncbi:MAG TPA: CRISPR-associated endonuclease Cas2 [Polyangiaceae bacterium]|jgi:CRISPR-associated protein Cas2|nr:CRISPR-associated endonuclease Cas2 [Polyangiaceae bacterium]
MRQTYIVSYDISDPKRLRKVFRLMKGYGEHVQLSVFRCELTHRALVELRVRLGATIRHDVDQVLFVDVGPEDGRGSTSISSLGRAYKPPERCAIVV